MSSTFTTSMAASGEFVRSYGHAEPQISEGEFLPVYNPAVLEPLRDSYQFVKSAEQSEKVIEEFRQCLDSHKRVVSMDDIARYGEMLPDLAGKIRSREAHCLLGPLRGASRPCATVEVMTRQNVQYHYFNYQNHTNNERRVQIISDLTSILMECDPGKESFDILITDTAVGGYGINNLAELLRSIQVGTAQFRNQKWNLQYFVLHAQSPGENLNRIKQVKSLHSIPGAFEVSLEDYQVPSLVIEDYDPALAIMFEGKVVKPCPKPGKFLLKQEGMVHVVETENAQLTFDELFAIGATDELIHSAHFEQIGSVWNEYTAK